MARRRQTVAEIMLKGNSCHLSRAELARRLAQEAAVARKAGTTVIAAPAPSKPVGEPAAPALCPVESVPRIDAASVCDEYARSVTERSILAGKRVIGACQRYLDMRATPKGWYFSAEKAQRVVDYLGGLGLRLLPWQTFCVGNLFGFLRTDDHLRLFRSATIFCAKKQGKTTLLAGLGLYMADADEEMAPEVYVAATSKSQSKDLCFRAAQMMRLKDQGLCDRTEAWKSCILWPKTFGKFEPLASNSERLNGRNIHLGILDELSDMPTPDLYEVFNSSTVGRKQPLLITISTVGRTRESIAGYEFGRAEQVLEGVIEDDSSFAFLATLDEGDDPFDEKVWLKSNPSLGVLVDIGALRTAAAKARATPSLKMSFLRYHANQWASATASSWVDVNDLLKPGNAYIADDEKDFSPVERIMLAESRLSGRKCIAGLDLALVNDLSVLALLFEPDDKKNGVFEVLARCYVPEDDVIIRSKEHRVPYESWRDQGLLIATPGNCTDYDIIRSDILALRKKYQIQELGFDIHLGADLMHSVEKDGLPVVQCDQGFYLTPAIQRCEKLIRQHRLCTHGNPIVNWCLSNVTLSFGVRQCRLDKSKSREKIDAAAAIIIALDRWIVRGPQTPSWDYSNGITFI